MARWHPKAAQILEIVRSSRRRLGLDVVSDLDGFSVLSFAADLMAISDAIRLAAPGSEVILGTNEPGQAESEELPISWAIHKLFGDLDAAMAESLVGVLDADDHIANAVKVLRSARTRTCDLL